jgi:hypothetical protein
MRNETALILSIIERLPDYGREALLQDLEPLITQKKYYTTAELSTRYGVTIQTLKNWEKDQILVPDLCVGKGCVRYSAAVIAEFEKNNPGRGVRGTGAES